MPLNGHSPQFSVLVGSSCEGGLIPAIRVRMNVGIGRSMGDAVRIGIRTASGHLADSGIVVKSLYKYRHHAYVADSRVGYAGSAGFQNRLEVVERY